MGSVPNVTCVSEGMNVVIYAFIYLSFIHSVSHSLSKVMGATMFPKQCACIISHSCYSCFPGRMGFRRQASRTEAVSAMMRACSVLGELEEEADPEHFQRMGWAAQ